MSELTLHDISEAMRHIDICMLATKTATGAVVARPMSNNRQVDYNGDAYFFTNGDSKVVSEITADPQVNLSYLHEPAILGSALYISVSGRADLVTNKNDMEKHWTKDLALWFKDGIDTPGLTMIHVKATHIHYWKNYQEGQVRL